MTMIFLDPALFRDKASEAARLLRSMGNEHRLMILCRLGAGEMTVSELQGHIGLAAIYCPEMLDDPDRT